MLYENEDAFQRWRGAPAGRSAFRRTFEKIASDCQACDHITGVCDSHGDEIERQLRNEFSTKIAAAEHPAVGSVPDAGGTKARAQYLPPGFQTLHDHLRDHLWWFDATKVAELEESIRAGIVALIAQAKVAATTHDPRAKHAAGVLCIEASFATFLGLHPTYEFETRPPAAAPAAGKEGGR